MPWNPEVYNQFKNIRYKPFYDLGNLIKPDGLRKAIDVGCGTGEQTSILAGQFEGVHFTGVDSSPEMLKKSEGYKHENLDFQLGTTEDLLKTGDKWDLIFSNAALQWSNDHQELFPKLLSLLNSGGQFAVQMPVQNENVLNQILLELVKEEPFAGYLNGWKRESPVLSIDDYAQLLFENGIKDLDLSMKVYPIIAEDHDTLYNFISGSALVPYMERLNEEQQEHFTRVFKERIVARFPKLPAIYAFKRLLIYGVKA